MLLIILFHHTNIWYLCVWGFEPNSPLLEPPANDLPTRWGLLGFMEHAYIVSHLHRILTLAHRYLENGYLGTVYEFMYISSMHFTLMLILSYTGIKKRNRETITCLSFLLPRLFELVPVLPFWSLSLSLFSSFLTYSVSTSELRYASPPCKNTQSNATQHASAITDELSYLKSWWHA